MPSPSRRAVLRTVISTMLTGTAGCVTTLDGEETTADESSGAQDDSGRTGGTTGGSAVRYDSLSDRGKKLFRAMVERGSIERPSDEVPDRLWEAEFVRYRGKTYAISKAPTDRNVAECGLAVDPASKDSADSSDLVAYDELSPDAKAAFRRSLNEGSYTVRGRGLPGELDEVPFVRYDGTYYRLRVSVGDVRVWNLSASADSQ